MTKNIFLIGIVAGLAAALALAGLFSALSTQSSSQMMHNPGMMGTTTTTQRTQSPWQWNGKAEFSASGVSNVNGVQIAGISISGDKEVTVNLKYNGNGTTPSVTVIASTNPSYMMGRMHASMGMMGGYYGTGPGMMYDYGYPGMMMYGYGSGLQDGTQWQQMQSMHGQMMDGSYGAMGPGMMNGYYGNPGTAANFNSTQWKEWNEKMIEWHNQMMKSNGQLNSTQWAQMKEMHNQMMAQAPASMMALMHGGTWNGTATTAFPASYFQSQTGSSVLDSGWNSGTALKVKLEGDGSAYDSNNIFAMVFPLTS